MRKYFGDGPLRPNFGSNVPSRSDDVKSPKRGRKGSQCYVPFDRVTVQSIFLRNTPGTRKTEDLYPLVLSIVRKAYKGNASHSELISEALTGLSEARDRYDPKRCKVKLSTFAFRRIQGRIADYVEKEGKVAARFTVTDPYVLDMNCIEGTEERLINAMRFRQIMKTIETKLPGRMANLLIDCYINELPEREHARKLRVPIKRLRELHDLAILKVKEAMLIR